MGGDKVLRAVGRAVGGGTIGNLQGPVSSAAARPGRARGTVSFPSSSSSVPQPRSLSAAPEDDAVGWQISRSSYLRDGDGWDSAEEEVGVGGGGVWFDERVVFGPAPSKEEVAKAVSTIQQVLVPATFSQVFEDGMPSTLNKDVVDKKSPAAHMIYQIPSDGSLADDPEQATHLCNPKTVQSQGIADAFRSLQINPSIKRMVVSLSTDKAVWDAVMKNDAVKELRQSFRTVEPTKLRRTDDSPDILDRILNWILEATKAKIMEFFDIIVKVVNDIFHPQEKDKVDAFGDVVKSSFLLSVVVFIVVVVFRVYRDRGSLVD